MDDFTNLIQAFEKGIENKKKGTFGKADVDSIFHAAEEFFLKHRTYVDPKQLEKIRDKWLAIAEGRIDKAHIEKKLRGGDPAHAIRSVLETLDKKIG